MKTFASQIYQAVQVGRLSQPFNASMVRNACPGWADRTYNTFLGKHAGGNGKESELFEKVSRGFYKLPVRNLGQAEMRKFWGKVKWEGNLNEMRSN